MRIRPPGAQVSGCVPSQAQPRSRQATPATALLCLCSLSASGMSAVPAGAAPGTQASTSRPESPPGDHETRAQLWIHLSGGS